MKLYSFQTDSRPNAEAFIPNGPHYEISHYARLEYPEDTIVNLAIRESKAKNWPKILYSPSALSAIFIREDLKELFDQFNGIKFFPAVAKNSEAKFLQPVNAPKYYWVKIEKEVRVVAIVNEAGEELPFYEQFGETVYNTGATSGTARFIIVDRDTIEPETDFFYLDKICHTGRRFCTGRVVEKLKKHVGKNMLFYPEMEDGRLFI